MSRLLHVAAFADAEALLAAVRACRALELEVVDTYTPYPVHGMEQAIGIRRSRLPVVCLIAGALGAAGAFLFQLWASAVDWPLDVGGKPFLSWPAFAPVAFETMVLCAGLATAFAFWWRSRLWPGAEPRLRLEGASDDRFYLVVAARGAAVDSGRIEQVLLRHGAGAHWLRPEEER